MIYFLKAKKPWQIPSKWFIFPSSQNNNLFKIKLCQFPYNIGLCHCAKISKVLGEFLELWCFWMRGWLTDTSHYIRTPHCGSKNLEIDDLTLNDVRGLVLIGSWVQGMDIVTTKAFWLQKLRYLPSQLYLLLNHQRECFWFHLFDRYILQLYSPILW